MRETPTLRGPLAYIVQWNDKTIQATRVGYNNSTTGQIGDWWGTATTNGRKFMYNIVSYARSSEKRRDHVQHVNVNMSHNAGNNACEGDVTLGHDRPARYYCTIAVVAYRMKCVTQRRARVPYTYVDT